MIRKLQLRLGGKRKKEKKILDPFCKYLMFTHMYSPEDVKEIGHEEIYRREQEYKKELGLV